MNNLPPAPTTQTIPTAGKRPVEPGEPTDPTEPVDQSAAEPGGQPGSSVFRGGARQTAALVVLVAMVALAVAFIIMVVVGVTNQSISALAVIATPIASMVAAYYGITLSIQQVRNERAETRKALAKAEAADTASRVTEVWAAQMESGLRVAMAKLNAARVNTDEVTKAAGTPDDFF